MKERRPTAGWCAGEARAAQAPLVARGTWAQRIAPPRDSLGRFATAAPLLLLAVACGGGHGFVNTLGRSQTRWHLVTADGQTRSAPAASASAGAEALWETFGNRQVSLTQTDGRRLEGRLLFAGAQVLVLRHDDGRVANVPRTSVASLQPRGRDVHSAQRLTAPRLRDVCASMSRWGKGMTILAVAGTVALGALGGWLVYEGQRKAHGSCTTPTCDMFPGLGEWIYAGLAFTAAAGTLIGPSLSAASYFGRAHRCRRVLDALRDEPETSPETLSSPLAVPAGEKRAAPPSAVVPNRAVVLGPANRPEPAPPPEPQEAPRPMSLEPGFDRPSADYRWFVQTSPGPEECLSACATERRCRAFTHLRPGVRGPSALCFLKERLAEKRANATCVSGAK